VQGTFTLGFWLLLSTGIYYLLALRKNYSLPALLATAIVSGFIYKGLELSQVLWARPLGSTEAEIANSLERYAAQDVAFSVTNRFLHGPGTESCDDLCRMMRQYTNVRFGFNPDLHLVETLARRIETREIGSTHGCLRCKEQGVQLSHEKLHPIYGPNADSKASRNADCSGDWPDFC
jgi:hypothetical protein